MLYLSTYLHIYFIYCEGNEEGAGQEEGSLSSCAGAEVANPSPESQERAWNWEREEAGAGPHHVWEGRTGVI